MKLVKQVVLFYREGSSDKVYEVDLSEVGAGRYVVNFRYGRRGSVLKEGTKTATPVALAAAQREFDDLVESKRKKGYQEIADPVAPPPRPTPKPKTAGEDPDARSAAILRRLNEDAGSSNGFIARFLGNISKAKWPLERVIWRAGELKLAAAAEPLVKLIGTGEPLRDYCIAWALGRCGNDASVSALGRLYGGTDRPDFVRRIACEALLKLSDDATRAEFKKDMRANLPPSLNEATGSAPVFAEALRKYLALEEVTRFPVLDLLYLLDDATIRPALLNLARTAPLRPPYFKYLRHWFKTAEYRGDAEMFGILAYRFEKEKQGFGSPRYDHIGFRPEAGGYEWLDVKKELKKPDSRLAFSSDSKRYLRMRVWRTLRKLAELNDPDFVKMAVGVLLPFTDADASEPLTREYYSWRTRASRTVRWDRFASYFGFNHLLYTNSQRYESRPGAMAWRCRPNYRPGDPAPATLREEAFPKLWDAHPVGLLHLLSESACTPVHEFASKALRANSDFCGKLDTEALVMLIERPYDVTARLGFDLARERYRADAPDVALVSALACCRVEEARVQAMRWIEAARDRFGRDAAFAASLLTCAHIDTRAGMRNVLRSLVFSADDAGSFSKRFIECLLNTPPDAFLADAAGAVFETFTVALRTLDFETILNLTGHHTVELQELGANILLNHETPPASFPAGIVTGLLESPFDRVRVIGVRILGGIPEDRLRNNLSLLIALATNPNEDIRQAFRPVAQRLMQGDPAFVAGFTDVLVKALGEPEPAPDVHRSIVELLRDDAPENWVANLAVPQTLALLGSDSIFEQEIGGIVLSRQPERFRDVETRRLVPLMKSEARAARDGLSAVWRVKADRFRNDPDEFSEALRILDAPWDDVRAFAFGFFRDEFTAAHFPPELLVSVADSVRPDVQRFGRELIERHFDETHGPLYLLRLSEHPTPAMQLFATSLLERFAAGDPERIAGLTTYFLSVLSRINTARASKARVFSFLENEALKSETAAETLAPMLGRLSLTIAVGDRAKIIQLLTAIRRAFPRVHSPLSIAAAEVRG